MGSGQVLILPSRIYQSRLPKPAPIGVLVNESNLMNGIGGDRTNIGIGLGAKHFGNTFEN
jgi:hypothetical protein